MIKIDASTIIPKRLGVYLLGIIPGLVFELSVAYADPLFAHEAIDRVRQVYPFHAYSLLLVFVVSCLIVGQTFFLLAWFADWLIDFVFRSLRYLILQLTLGSDWFYRAVGRLQGMPPKRNVKHLWRMVMWARQKKIPFEVRPILKCQRMVATSLLKRKYGVTPSKGQWEWVDREWQVWLAILGKAPAGFRETYLTMRTFLGCSFAELAALCLMPALRNYNFVIMTSVLFAAGCFQSLSFAKNRREPIRANLTRLLLVMEELSDTNRATNKKENGSDTGAQIAVNTDNDSDVNEGE